jgi:hypothetical protein
MAVIINNEYCFVHVMKAGGNWVRAALDAIAEDRGWKIVQSGAFHGFPIRDMTGLKIFCFVREPVYWYRSYWAHRVSEKWSFGTGWEIANDSELWMTLVSITQPYASDNFEHFVRGCATGLPNLVYWVFGHYALPRVDHIFKSEEARSSLMNLFDYSDLTFLDNVPSAVNTGRDHLGYELPEITEEIASLVRVSERHTYQKYGY